MRFFAAIIVSLSLIFCAFAPLALAQGPSNNVGPTVDDFRASLKQIEEAISGQNVTEQDLSGLRNRIDAITQFLRQEVARISPEVAPLEQRLDKLTPAEGVEITQALKTEIDDVTARIGALKADISLKNSLIVEAEQLTERIVTARQAMFQARLLQAFPSVFSTSYWRQLGPELQNTHTRFTQVLTREVSRLQNMQGNKNALYLGGVLISLGLSIGLLRLLKGSTRLRRREVDYPATSALIAFLTLSVVMIGALAGISAALEAGGYIPGRLEIFFDSVIFSLAITFAAINLLGAILNLRANQTSFIALPLGERQKLKSGFSWVLYLTLGYTFIMALLRLINAPETVATLTTVCAGLVLGPLYLRLSKLLMHVSVSKAHFARLFGFMLFVAGLLTPLAALLGYVNLAKFIINQLVWVCFVLTFAWLMFVWLEEQFTAKTDTDCLENQTGFTKLCYRFFGLSTQQARFLGVVFQGLGRLVLTLVTLMALVLPWGGVGENLFARLSSNLTQFSIAGFPISPVQVIIALGLFFGGLMLVRLVKSWLTNSFLPLTPLDKGVRDSLSTFFGYVGFIIVTLLTLSYMGLELQNLAIIAGALSLGIGFGLQSIVNNFVSGLILLAERPIKVGDWIVVGAEEGNVKKINVRSTEIETFDRASIIVPNADLITGVVKNWMHSNRTGRIRVMIGVSYDADPEQVRDILLECAKEHENVLSYPVPAVFFQDFGDNALIFEVLAHLGEVSTSMTTRSDLRFAILKRLRAAKIEIPYPQRDIHIRSDVRNKD